MSDKIFRKWNPNPVGNRTEDCVQRAISAALDVPWEAASDIIHEAAKAMGLPEHSDAVWGAVLRQNGFYRAILPNTCPDCYTVRDFCRDHPVGVFTLKTSGHVCTVIDGRVWDTFDSSDEVPVYYWYQKEA